MSSSPRHVGDRRISHLYAQIYAVVRAIPRGRVMTYGEVARQVGMPRGARVVGYALRASLLDEPVPWQRVLGRRRPQTAQVTIKDPVGAALQHQLLEEEGVSFSRDGGVDLVRYGCS